MHDEAASILVLANPAAGNGTGTQAGRRAVAELESLVAAGKVGSYLAGAEVDAAFLGSEEQTRAIIESSAGRKAIIAVGGDGLVHLAVNALMKVSPEARPAFGVVPAGTGNDYARALGIPLDIREAVRQVAKADPRPIDLGVCNDEFFAETVSFGLDAAIALDTVERRKKTGRNDAGVYFSSGIDQLLHHLDSREYRGSIDGMPIEGKCVTFAVQVGPFYGGGFKICPDAVLDDGLLDICVSHPPITVPRAIYIFVRAKSGKHVGMKPIEFARAHRLVIEFDEEPPCQIDGEPLHATRYEICCEEGALRILA